MTKKKATSSPEGSPPPMNAAPSAGSPPTSSSPDGAPIVLSRTAVNEIIVGLLQTVSIQRQITEFLTRASSASPATPPETKKD